MYTPWIVLLISAASALDPETSTTPNTNITTLYPVNQTIVRNETELPQTDTDSKVNVSPQTWKIESGFAASNLTEADNKTMNAEGKEKKEILKDFKPSQHLGSFFDEDSAEVIKKPAFGPIGQKPSGFVRPAETDYHNHASFNKIPKDIYSTHKEFPYKFEDTVYTRTKDGWQEVMDSRPTVEAPVKVPAGGFYKSPEAFKDRPHSGEDVGLQFYEEGKEHGIKKRVNPWQNLLRLVTAFIPVGLIISALTPSLITIQNVNDQPASSLPYRRADAGGGGPNPGPEGAGGAGSAGGARFTSMAPISERCRRRLLCELHSERNYIQQSSAPRRHMKHCYKIHCEDTEALWRTLRWLFTYNQAADDHRGRLLT
ncbi:unnamed protein product [Chrysodeixis includens]|uniref:Uncharacterized protein n=1 Tax=Chrysodeixis includens TaxID=689277 RepID=A0A9P0C0R7_CHRIL|nr:unnamed protein product [Chrysodeixis includens]